MDLIIPVYLIFAAAAYQDYRKREVSDWLTAVAWLFSTFAFGLQPFVLAFVGAWLVAELFSSLKKPLAGFGDVLWFPVFYSLAQLINGQGLIMGLIAVFVSQAYLWYTTVWLNLPKEKIRGVPFVLIMLALLLLAMGGAMVFSL